MAVGKGSLNRVLSAEKKSEIVTLLPNNVVELEISSISFKKTEDKKKITDSVKNYGVILPVVVGKTKDGLKVIDGAKRLTALVELGEKTVKAVVVEGDCKKVSAELKKFDKVVKVEVEKGEIDIHEEKFKAIDSIEKDDMPIYLL